MNIRVLMAALLLSAPAFAQKGKDTPPPMVNLVQEPEVNVPGTKVYLLRPEGAQFGKNFTGLEMENAVIQIYDLSVGNYYTNGASFSKEGFEKKGVKVYEYRETEINGYPAKFVKISANTGIAYSLIFGDSTFSVMAMGIMSADDAATASMVKTCLFSMKYKKQAKVDPFASAVFKLTANASKMKFAMYAGNMYIFNYSGSKESHDKSEPVIMVSTIPSDATTTPESLAKGMIDGITKKAGAKPTVISKSADKVNGYDAYTEEVVFAQQLETGKLYMTVLKSGTTCLNIMCMSNTGSDADMQEFRKFIGGIRFK